MRRRSACLSVCLPATLAAPAQTPAVFSPAFVVVGTQPTVPSDTALDGWQFCVQAGGLGAGGQLFLTSGAETVLGA
jgi:hypothetical protein